MVITKLLKYLLLILGIFFFVFPYKFKLFYWLFLISFILALIFELVIKKLELSDKEYLLILIIIWLNAIGELWFYTNFQYYDKLLHFIDPFLISVIYYTYLKKNNQMITFFFPFTILGMLAFFEIIEWLIDSLGFPMLGVYTSSGIEIMSKLTDTMIDLLAGCLGILTFLITKQQIRFQH